MIPLTDENMPDDAIIDRGETSSSDDSTPQQDGGEGTNAQESTTKIKRRPRGKIAKLCKADRDKLNTMLQDGVPYAEVIARLGEVGKGITPRNVSSWHTGPGYQRWERDQEWLEEMRADQESGLDVLPQVDAGKFNEAALQVAITQLFRAVRHIGSGQLKEKLGGDPQGFARLVNALARACRETNNLQKYHDACAKAAAAQLKQLDPNREISDRENELFAKKVEELFHVKLPRPATGPGTVQTPMSNVQNAGLGFSP